MKSLQNTNTKDDEFISDFMKNAIKISPQLFLPIIKYRFNVLQEDLNNKDTNESITHLIMKLITELSSSTNRAADFDEEILNKMEPIDFLKNLEEFLKCKDINEMSQLRELSRNTQFYNFYDSIYKASFNEIPSMDSFAFKDNDKKIFKELGHMLLKHRFDNLSNNDNKSLMIDSYNNMAKFLFKLAPSANDDMQIYQKNTLDLLIYYRQKGIAFFEKEVDSPQLFLGDKFKININTLLNSYELSLTSNKQMTNNSLLALSFYEITPEFYLAVESSYNNMQDIKILNKIGPCLRNLKDFFDALKKIKHNRIEYSLEGKYVELCYESILGNKHDNFKDSLNRLSQNIFHNTNTEERENEMIKFCKSINIDDLKDKMIKFCKSDKACKDLTSQQKIELVETVEKRCAELKLLLKQLFKYHKKDYTDFIEKLDKKFQEFTNTISLKNKYNNTIKVYFESLKSKITTQEKKETKKEEEEEKEGAKDISTTKPVETFLHDIKNHPELFVYNDNYKFYIYMPSKSFEDLGDIIKQNTCRNNINKIKPLNRLFEFDTDGDERAVSTEVFKLRVNNIKTITIHSFNKICNHKKARGLANGQEKIIPLSQDEEKLMLKGITCWQSNSILLNEPNKPIKAQSQNFDTTDKFNYEDEVNDFSVNQETSALGNGADD